MPRSLTALQEELAELHDRLGRLRAIAAVMPTSEPPPAPEAMAAPAPAPAE